MQRWVLWLCAVFTTMPLYAQNIVLVNGTIIDGSGKPRLMGNVRIREGKIADLGAFKPQAGETVFDVKGMIVAPGFVDLATLSPPAIQKDAGAVSLTKQGVTSALLGADGTGLYSVEDFMLPFDEKPPAINIGMLVGHGTVRHQIMGASYKRAPTADEIARMTELISDAMKQGAFGMGTDLRAEPASLSTPEELMLLTKTVSKFGGTLVMTLRDDSPKEAIALSRDDKLPVVVLGANKAAQAEIDKARAQRVDISADSYSYAELMLDKTITLERAIQRMSATPASRVGLRERGILRRGARADIVVFSPSALPEGMKYVFVNGIAVVKDGQPTDARPGQALR